MQTPISSEALRGLAEAVQRLARIICQWLPVAGDSEAKTGSWRTAENWFHQAAELYTACERIRNPSKLPFGIASGRYCGPSACSAAWFEIQNALDEIAVAWRLQGVSDASGIPHLPFGQDVPAIDGGTLKRLELAASEILEAVTPEAELSESTPEAAGTSLEQLEHPEIVQGLKLPTNPDIAEVWNAIQATKPRQANVSEICRDIAKKQGGTEAQIASRAKSIRSMFNTWRRKNIG
jgi:hypothetical protein